MKNKLIILSLLTNLVFAAPTILNVKEKTISVNGRNAKVLTIEQNDGTWGYYAKAGDKFNVTVKNDLNVPTVIHWHGLTLPNNQDGTPLTQTAIAAHGEYNYDFKLKDVGTFWMHSHEGLQEAALAEAPLIIEAPDDSKYQQVVVMFQGFNFKSPEEVLAQIKRNSAKMGEMTMRMGRDLNDANFDAYLTNYHTPQDPQIVEVTPGTKVKLRFINGSVSSNFWIHLGNLSSTAQAVAVDGRDIVPYNSSSYQIAEAQRMDIIVEIPKSGGTFPILGQVEGLKNQTGLILTTNKNLKTSIPVMASTVAAPFNDSQELHLSSIEQLPKKRINKVVKLTLGGNMAKYQWSINGQVWPNVKPIEIKQGSRVELFFYNNTMMAHPMHLHGFAFKVVSINGKNINGAMRDTIEILPHETVKVVFDADEPGKWFLHCHIGWHMPTGMMTYINIAK
jgi:FtsP/CotA-like multicopper oxidase with cupredoxin domain